MKRDILKCAPTTSTTHLLPVEIFVYEQRLCSNLFHHIWSICLKRRFMFRGSIQLNSNCSGTKRERCFLRIIFWAFWKYLAYHCWKQAGGLYWIQQSLVSSNEALTFKGWRSLPTVGGLAVCITSFIWRFWLSMCQMRTLPQFTHITAVICVVDPEWLGGGWREPLFIAGLFNMWFRLDLQVVTFVPMQWFYWILECDFIDAGHQCHHSNTKTCSVPPHPTPNKLQVG